MKIEILEIARVEFRASKEFYELEQSGLGVRFENEIKQALLRIQQYPKAWSLLADFRRFSKPGIEGVDLEKLSIIEAILKIIR